MNDDEVTETFSDEELAEQALAADPDAPLPAAALPFHQLTAGGDACLLPDWYMPAPGLQAHQLTGWRRRTVVALVATFVLINVCGLCSTYGWVVAA